MKIPEATHNFFDRVLLYIASGLSSILYIVVYRLLKYRYAVVIDNLSKSFPEKSQEEVEVCARTYYKHLCDLIIEPLLFVTVTEAGRRKLANYTNTELLEKFYVQESNIITLASHCGNWEYLINIPNVLGFKTYTAYTPISSKFFDRFVFKLRSMYGVILIPKKYFFRGALTALKSKGGDPAMVVVIADQRPAPGSMKYFVHFLEQSTHVQIGAERLASSSGATVVFLDCLKTSRFHYDFTFHVVTENVERCLPMEVTERYYQLLEQNILKSPAHWLWSHKRWKPLSEKGEKVMPAL